MNQPIKKPDDGQCGDSITPPLWCSWLALLPLKSPREVEPREAPHEEHNPHNAQRLNQFATHQSPQRLRPVPVVSRTPRLIRVDARIPWRLKSTERGYRWGCWRRDSRRRGSWRCHRRFRGLWMVPMGFRVHHYWRNHWGGWHGAQIQPHVEGSQEALIEV